MRYLKGQKDETRERITATAAQLFRRDGITATGIQGLMKACDLTNGAFYVHFDSKEDLVQKALEQALAERMTGLEQSLAAGADGLVAAVYDYLSPAHVGDAACGCPTAALVSEVARSSSAVRDTYTAGLTAVLDGVAQALPAQARANVPAVFAMLIGCVQLARASSDAELTRRILSSGLDAALALLGLAEAERFAGN